MEAKDADEMKTFIQRSVPGSDRMRLIIFHAGLLPPPYGSPSSALDSELSFFEEFAKSEGYHMAYYTTSPYSSARLAPSSSSSSSEVPKLTRSTLVVQPKFANSMTWLLQKQTPVRLSNRSHYPHSAPWRERRRRLFGPRLGGLQVIVVIPAGSVERQGVWLL
jgi:hypothetical protein